MDVPICSDEEGSAPEMWFTENETNSEVLFNHPNRSFYTKDAFHRKLISEADDAVNPDNEGTKACAHYTLDLPPRMPFKFIEPFVAVWYLKELHNMSSLLFLIYKN